MKLPKIVLPGKLAHITGLMGEMEGVVALIKEVVQGFKDGVGPGDIEKCSRLAYALEKLLGELKSII